MNPVTADLDSIAVFRAGMRHKLCLGGLISPYSLAKPLQFLAEWLGALLEGGPKQKGIYASTDQFHRRRVGRPEER